MFLTTNRVGVLDDAIKSRITWIAYYPPLDEQQTKKIWRVNIKLLEERNKRLQVDKKGILKFAKEHFASSVAKGSTWNGRQIQNAFKVATALAEWDAYSKDVQRKIDTRVQEEDVCGQPTLLASHFDTIAVGTQAFSNYLQEATGCSEAERAFNAMERADDYTIEDDTYNGGSIATQRDNDGNFSASSPSSRQRRSSSITAASPKSFGRDLGPPPHLQPTRHQASNQQQHRPFLPSPGQNPNSMSPPQSQSRKAFHQVTAVATSMDSHRQSPRDNRFSYSASLSQATAIAAATSSSSPHSSSLRAKQNGRHRSSSNSALIKPASDEEEDSEARDWHGSSDDDGGDGHGHGHGNATSDGEIDEEEW